jgi:hypothetical protein
MPNREPRAIALPQTLPGSGWGPWAPDAERVADEPAEDRAPWLGAAVSLMLWGCATWLAVQWI